jgi:integrase
MLLVEFFHEVYKPLRLLGRSARTETLYLYSIRLYSETLGRPATLEDLSDILVAKHLQRLIDQKRSPHGVNKERAQLCAIWNFAAKKRLVDEFPSVPTIDAPENPPIAWSQKQLNDLFQSCKQENGQISGIPASDWWYTKHCVLWDTGERIGATMQIKWDDLSEGWLTVKAEYRKRKKRTVQTKLHEATLDSLQELPRVSDLIFPWSFSETYLYRVYNRILKRAGLPTDSRSKFHRMRKSVASHFHAAGGDATMALGHSSNAITRKCYLDVRIAGQVNPSDLLFRAG